MAHGVTVGIILPDGRQLAITGRAAVLAVLAYKHQDAINDLAYGQVVLNCTPLKTHLSVDQHLERLHLDSVDLVALTERPPKRRAA